MYLSIINIAVNICRKEQHGPGDQHCRRPGGTQEQSQQVQKLQGKNIP